MKLIEREPTPEMIEAMRDNGATFTGMFKATYDAAPEIQQEPVAFLSEGGDVARSKAWMDEMGFKCSPLYTFPPDTQVEIAKRDAQIAELEADQDKANAAVAIGNYLGKTYNYAWCDTSLASQTIDLLKEQAAEISKWKEAARTKHLEAIDWAGKQQEATEQISRLQKVIAKCKDALEDSHQNINQERGFASEIEHDIEQALAAIKEEGL